MDIKLTNNRIIKNCEKRIREYCRIEIYEGYDNKHTIDNLITLEDIITANEIYAMIDRYDKNESKGLLNKVEILKKYLEYIPNKEIIEIHDDEWMILKLRIKTLIREFSSIHGFGMAKTFKILHIKRPALFPILDSKVIIFLGYNPDSEKRVDIAINCLKDSRYNLINNKDIFFNLQKKLIDLPIKLSKIRMYDILCWTEQKWIIEKNLHAKYGYVNLKNIF